MKGSPLLSKVGFIGFVPPQIMNRGKANLNGKVISKDMIQMANKYVPQMKANGADWVIATPQSGLEAGDLSIENIYHATDKQVYSTS